MVETVPKTAEAGELVSLKGDVAEETQAVALKMTQVTVQVEAQVLEKAEKNKQNSLYDRVIVS